MGTGADLATIDAIGLGLVGAFVILGFVRGLWWQVIRLAGLFGAVLLARALSPRLAPELFARFPELPVRAAHGASWFAIFLLALAAATLLGLLGRKILEAMQLGLADRVGGGVVGAATGFVLHVALLIALCQLGSQAFVATTISGSRSETIVDLLGRRFPVVLGREAGHELGEVLRRARGGPASPLEDPAPPTVR